MAFPKNPPAQGPNRARMVGAAVPPLPQAQPRLSAQLEWRNPWWFWHGLAFAASTLLAPTFLAIGGLLIRDAHSDHPVFWPALMLVVALANLLAMAAMNQLHHRRPFTGRKRLAAGYGVFSMLAGGVLFLVLGWATGFLRDFVVPLSSDGASPGRALFWSLALAAVYSLLSFAHAGVLYVWLGFRDPEQDSEWLDEIGWRLG